MTAATTNAQDAAVIKPEISPNMDLTLFDQPDWELLASGDGRKLERFGDQVIERPAPQAIWSPASGAPWNIASSIFNRRSDGSGDWVHRGRSVSSWDVRLLDIHLQLRFTGFGNLGAFPEHAVHWSWIKDQLSKRAGAEVLNLFSYTGAASIFCAKSGATVTHVDSAKSVNTWAAVNASASKTDEGKIRYIADDALKFARRETRRGRKYDGIILDPPTFGRGVKGEVWKIERDFGGLLDICRSLLREDAYFLLVTSHSPGVTPAVLRGLLSGIPGRLESGEMLLSKVGREPSLPAGTFARIAYEK